MDIIWYMASYGRLILWYIDGIHVTIYENVTHGIYGSTMDPMATGCPHGFVLHTGRHGTSGCIGRRRLGVSTRAARRFQRCASVVLPLPRRRVHGLDMEKRIGYRIYDEYRWYQYIYIYYNYIICNIYIYLYIYIYIYRYDNLLL